MNTDGPSVISSSTQSVMDTNMLCNGDTLGSIEKEEEKKKRSSAIIHYNSVRTSKKGISPHLNQDVAFRELKGAKDQKHVFSSSKEKKDHDEVAETSEDKESKRCFYTVKRIAVNFSWEIYEWSKAAFVQKKKKK